jgi:serine phosphatase RsbU (regulator of sigma subunit)
VTNATFIEQGKHIDLGWVGQSPAPGSMTDWIIRQREPLLFGDLLAYLERTSKAPITPTRFGIERHARAWAGVPLLAKDGESIGVLSLQDYRPDLYDEQTVDFLRLVASNFSVGVQMVRLFEERERQLVENARLFDEARAHAESAERQAERMELVNRISLLLSSRLDQQEILDLAAQEVVRLFRADHTGTVLFDEAMAWGTVVAEYPARGAVGLQVPLADNPLIDELLTLRRPVCITSTASDERARVSRAIFERLGIVSLMVVPLISRGRMIGSISLDVVGAPRAFMQEEQTLFLTVAASIASAVENARLFAAEQAARRTADTLREVARVLSSSFDPREVLQLILRELRNVIVYDSASIMLLDRGILRIAAHSGWEDNPDLMNTPFQLDTRGGALLVARQRQPVVIPDTAASPDWIVHERFADIRSWLGVPLLFKGEVLGVLNIDSRQPNHFTARDAEAAGTFADHAAVALENARLYEESVTRVEQELEIAGRIQSNLFPRTLPRLAGLALDARCLPARETGGDFFDFVTLSGQDGTRRLAIMVGDASGKSIPGAMLMAVARSIVRSEARDHEIPQVVMRETNDWISRDVPPRSFVALCYATLDLPTRRLALANAGQLAPLRRQPDGQMTYLEVPGPTLPLGILPDTPYAALDLALEPGDLLVFYTDGIVEAQDANRQLFGFERLEALVREFGDLSPADLIDIVLQELGAFMRGVPQHDDMTIVALRVE